MKKSPFPPRSLWQATAILMFPYLASAWEPLAVSQDRRLFMPGSQHGSVALPDSSKCSNCHGGYDTKSEPHHAWQGSMMGQATRDPLWLASMAVAAQDSIWALGNPNAADLCLRCHTPTGWLGGRSDPVNATALRANLGDFEGVNCSVCHLMVDPFPGLGLQPGLPPETNPAHIAAANATKSLDLAILADHRLFDGSPFFNPATELPVKYGTASTQDVLNYIEAGSGQFFIDPNTNNRRGPRLDVSTKSHNFQYSRFHKSQSHCRACHDVSNPALANLTLGADASESRSAASYFHVERTSSEFELSAYAAPGGAPVRGPLAAAGITHATRCQDCHMPRVSGRLAKQGDPRTDVANHSLAGGNTWITAMLATVDTKGAVLDNYNRTILRGAKYPGATIDVAGLENASAALSDGSARAAEMLTRAATISHVHDSWSGAAVRVHNHTGHKLISGFPEGRRMWLNVRFLNAAGDVIGEINPYQPLVTTTNAQSNKVYVSGGDLTVTRDDLVYEVAMSSSLTGETKTFHMVLATNRHKDNRIPPRGFRIGEAVARQCEPRRDGQSAADLFSAAEYEGGFNEVSFAMPADAAGWEARLFYQTTSKPYIEFLRDQIKGTANTLASPTPSGEAAAYIIQTDPFFATLKGWGDAIWDLWLHNGGSAPVLMTAAISPPRVEDIHHDGASSSIRVAGLPGRSYQLERATNPQGPWQAVGPPVAGAGQPLNLRDPSPPQGGSGFYRVRCWMP